MSSAIEIPDRIFLKAYDKLISMTFNEAITSMIKGPAYHIVIEPDCPFEIAPYSLKSVGERNCAFTFAICHECSDDRTHWVTDKLISVSICDPK